MHRAKLSTEPLGDEVAKSLEAYARNNRFERAVRHKMATSLTSGELQRLRNMFEELDTEDTGEIPFAELKKVMLGAAGEDSGIEAVLSTLDVDGDGTIDWKEFVAACIQDHTLYNQENLEKVFAALDTDKSGALGTAEVEAFFGTDHELGKEIKQKLREKRGLAADADLETTPMTYKEFHELLSEGAAAGKEKRKKTRTKTRVKVDEDAPVKV